MSRPGIRRRLFHVVGYPGDQLRAAGWGLADTEFSGCGNGVSFRSPALSFLANLARSSRLIPFPPFAFPFLLRFDQPDPLGCGYPANPQNRQKGTSKDLRVCRMSVRANIEIGVGVIRWRGNTGPKDCQFHHCERGYGQAECKPSQYLLALADC